MHKKKDMSIRSYDGKDAFYTGTDEDYAEFLRNAEIRFEEAAEKAEPVENTQKINLNETINLQNVIDRFKKKAGGLGNTAKNLRESVVSKVDSMKKNNEDTEDAYSEPSSGEISRGAENPVSEKIESSMKASAARLNELKDEVRAMSDMPERVGGVDRKLSSVTSSVEEALGQLSGLSDKLDSIEKLLGENKKEGADNSGAIQDAIDSVGDGISDIRQAVASISRLNDSVFDLKNTQLNTKNAVSNLETAFSRLKKKCVLGVTIVSILCAIIIALEILIMLS